MRNTTPATRCLLCGRLQLAQQRASHHVGYLYDVGGDQWETQQKVREIADDEYANRPSGLDGDDDFEQMSAWYIFNGAWFYPGNPASAIT